MNTKNEEVFNSPVFLFVLHENIFLGEPLILMISLKADACYVVLKFDQDLKSNQIK